MPACAGRGSYDMKKYNYNNPNLKNKRRALRKNQTDSERVIWQHLRSKQIQGSKFFRQYSIGPYVLDFFCPKMQLAIEIDGGQHAEDIHRIHDEKRTKFLRQNGIIVIRFWNNEVLNNTEGVLEKILEKTSQCNFS